MSSQRANSMEAQDNIRKRVCKACDRCRLKKSKCDGASPCSRCKADNAICVFGERKKSQDKVYPKGYVEMLEQQQAQLVNGIRELYSRVLNGQSWTGAPLREQSNGHPLTHDILDRLDLLGTNGESNNNYEGFEEDCNRMQQKLVERGAPYTHRRGSISSESDHGHSSSSGSSYGGTPTTKMPSFSDPFSRNRTPPTPPSNSPFPRQSQIAPPVKQEIIQPTGFFANPVSMGPGALDPSALTRTAWAPEPMMMDEPLDFGNAKGMYAFETFNNTFESASMMLDPMTGQMMSDWNDPNDLDFNNFIQNPMNP